jgi:sugar phosphate isomerase/epimerase
MVEAAIFSAGAKPDEFQLCLSLNTLRNLDYESQLKVTAQAGWRAVGIPMDRLEEYLATGRSIEEAKALLESNDLCPVEILGFRYWIYTRGKDQIEMANLFRKFSRISRKLGGAILLASTRYIGSFDSSLARENFKEICRIAAEDGNRVGLEFLPFSPINTIKNAWSIVETTDPPNGGIVLDFFHFLKGGSHLTDLEEVPIEKIFDVHVDDLKDNNPEEDLSILSRNYRVLPGEGDFIFDDVLQYLFDRGYSGYYSLEVLNKDYPGGDPLKLAIRAKESLERILKDSTKTRSRRY